jgi:hypothetical protein
LDEVAGVGLGTRTIAGIILELLRCDRGPRDQSRALAFEKTLSSKARTTDLESERRGLSLVGGVDQAGGRSVSGSFVRHNRRGSTKE